MKRLSIEAYEALREALAVVTWHKSAFETFLRGALRESPELLSPLNFELPKRKVADALVDGLMSHERRYQDTTIRLMLELASRTRFPDIERLAEPDRDLRLREARYAVARLSDVTRAFAETIAAQERLDADRAAMAERAASRKRFSDDLANLRAQFLQMHSSTDAHARGYDFERFLIDLFALFDLEPRLAYSTAIEQIDGSLTYDTDDYIVEAKWLATTVSREQADAFARKVQRKGRNALGIFVAVSGFSTAATTAYGQETPFLTVDGRDLFAVLDGHISLGDLIRLKKRHANETGSCLFPVSAIGL